MTRPNVGILKHLATFGDLKHKMDHAPFASFVFIPHRWGIPHILTRRVIQVPVRNSEHTPCGVIRFVLHAELELPKSTELLGEVKNPLWGVRELLYSRNM